MKKMASLSEIVEKHASTGFGDLLRTLLTIDPAKRADAASALNAAVFQPGAGGGEGAGGDVGEAEEVKGELAGTTPTTATAS